MKILIYGAGGLGSVFGGYLARSHDVTLICRARHADAINKSGLLIYTPENSQFTVFPRAYSSIEKLKEIYASIVISVKTYDLEQACRAISTQFNLSPTLESSKAGYCPKIILLQNGLGNEELASQFFPDRFIYRILTTNGAFFIKPGVIKHSGRGKTQIGKYVPLKKDEFLLQMSRVLKSAGLETIPIYNLKERVWQKLAVNAAINPLTALTGLKNGGLLRSSTLIAIIKEIVLEVETVARVSEDLRLKNTLEKVIEVLKDTRQNKSSMLQDIEAGRKTEIDFINVQIVKRGQRLNLRTPYNQLLAALIIAREIRD
ncbi:MAG: ketopantoate reductase family protein [Candidatus Hermodarchaeota archaeon]